MRLSFNIYLAVCVVLELFGIIVFLKGFFPIKASVHGYSTFCDVKRDPTQTRNTSHTKSSCDNFPPTFGKMIFVLIDALRADFVLPTRHSKLPQMKFVKNLISKRETHSFLARAHPPTVTMPRIKALTSGTIPGFVDVVLNFDSKAFTEDNLITQLHRQDKKMVFYGDDTWMRLFPNHFLRTDGTTSFFVTDYTEVDNNVTRHLTDELSVGDWDVLILHYLGLDHIGHLAGPTSSLVPHKLKEMDDVIKTLYTTITKQDASGGLPTLLVVCGDHGMNDQGSHGGATSPEILTPLILLSSAFSSGRGSSFSAADIYQIDVVPTLSLLLGVPIPQNSLGSLVWNATSTMSTEQRLQAAYINAQQVLQVFKANFKAFKSDPAFVQCERAVQSHTAWLQRNHSSPAAQEQLAHKVALQYLRAVTKMREKLADSLSDYDLLAMAEGSALLWMTLLALFSAQYYRVGDVIMLPDLTFMAGLGGAVLFMEMLILHMYSCTSQGRSSFLCRLSPVGLTYALVVPVMFAFTLIYFPWRSAVAYVKQQVRALRVLPRLLLGGCVAHPVSLAASSFVEEEHQTWYFYITTIHILLLFILVQSHHHPVSEVEYSKGKSKSKTKLSAYDKEYLNKFKSASKAVPQNKKENKRSEKNNLFESDDSEEKESEKLSKGFVMEDPGPDETGQGEVVLGVVASLLLCRILRGWNRTGDKWSHLPDIGDWLVSPVQKPVLSVLCGAAVCVVCMCSWLHGVGALVHLLFMCAAAAIYCFRAANGSVLLPGAYSTMSKGLIEARIAYIMCLIIILEACINLWNHSLQSPTQSKAPDTRTSLHPDTRRRKPLTLALQLLVKKFQLVWILLMLLLMRPHNFTVVAIAMIQEQFLLRALKPTGLRVWSKAIIYYCMGQAAFFSQGNSNSIATVDVSAGYVGLQEYSPPLIGLLMAVSTYAGPIFWNLSLILLVLEQRPRHCNSLAVRPSAEFPAVLLTWLSMRALPVAGYVLLVAAQRYHLFVWTVFSPKLLYEGVHTVGVAVLITLVVAMGKVMDRIYGSLADVL